MSTTLLPVSIDVLSRPKARAPLVSHPAFTSVPGEVNLAMALDDQRIYLRDLSRGGDSARLPYATRRALKQWFFRYQSSGNKMPLHENILVAGKDWIPADRGAAALLRLSYSHFDTIIYLVNRTPELVLGQPLQIRLEQGG